MRLLVFEDSAAEDLAPITVGRPAMAITCASMRLLDWLESLEMPIAAVVRPHLRELVAEDYPALAGAAETLTSDEAVLAVNGRAVPSSETFAALRRLAAGGPAVLRSGETIAAAHLSAAQARTLAGADPQRLSEAIDQLDRPPDGSEAGREDAPGNEPADPPPVALFELPHDVVAQHMRWMPDHLEARLAAGRWRQLRDGVFVGEGVTIGDHVVFDTRHGPILLDAGVQVGPFCYLSGPVYAGPKSRIAEYAALKDGVSLGHTTKIGGEVEASIVEPYTNKQHHGFLGHSYLGSWINLGAGTCNSDLKNTYGTVNMEYRGRKVASGMQFLGCIMGDYSKTAINTGIFTGKVIGVCTMLYGFVTTNVPSFVNYARLFGQVADLPPDVMVATQRRMFARRDVQQRACDIQLIHEMYRVTQAEREQELHPLAGL